MQPSRAAQKCSLAATKPAKRSGCGSTSSVVGFLLSAEHRCSARPAVERCWRASPNARAAHGGILGPSRFRARVDAVPNEDEVLRVPPSSDRSSWMEELRAKESHLSDR